MKLLVATILAAAAMMLTGCANWDLRGEGFDPERFPDVPVRAEEDTGPKRDAWGFSTKAREIENRLGVD